MLERIREVLEFYADKKHYEFNTDPWAAHDSVVAADRGKKARELLEKLRG